MSLSLNEIRKNTKKARATYERAKNEHFALGAFNIDDQATLNAVSLAAKKKNAPVLVEVSQGEVDSMGLDNVRDMVTNFKEAFGIEMYINLDHSPSVQDCKMV